MFNSQTPNFIELLIGRKYCLNYFAGRNEQDTSDEMFMCVLQFDWFTPSEKHNDVVLNKQLYEIEPAGNTSLSE